MIDKLEMFIILAREQHFGRASEAIGITQPSLSAAMRQLEDALGVTLVRRGTRFQGLTPEGERLLDWAQRIVGDVKTMRAEFHSARNGLTGQLRLGIIPTAVAQANDLILPLMERHAQLEISLATLSNDDILTQLEQMRLDAGLIYQTQVPAKLEQIPLYREKLLLVAHAAHPLIQRDEIDWADLAEEPICLLSSNMRNRAIVWSHLTAAGRTRPPRVEADSLLSLLYQVKGGHLISVIPAGLATMMGDIQGVSCKALPGDGDMVSLVTAARQPRKPAIEAFLSRAKAHFAGS